MIAAEEATMFLCQKLLNGLQIYFLVIRGQVWPRGWSPQLLRGGAQEDLAFWVGSLYTCPGKGAFALGSRCNDLTAAI